MQRYKRIRLAAAALCALLGVFLTSCTGRADAPSASAQLSSPPFADMGSSGPEASGPAPGDEPLNLTEMTAEEVTIWLYDYFSSENGFVVLIDPLTNVLDEPTEQMSDAQLTAFACYYIPWKPEGGTREDFNEVARKYFGREIENFDNGITFPAKDGSDQLDGVSFSFDSSVYMLLKSLTEENGVYSGTFYCLNVSDSHWEGAPGESQKAREELLSGDVSSFEDTPVWLVQVDFEVKEDEAGETYLLYRDVDILETDVKDIVLYQGAS